MLLGLLMWFRAVRDFIFQKKKTITIQEEMWLFSKPPPTDSDKDLLTFYEYTLETAEKGQL